MKVLYALLSLVLLVVACAAIFAYQHKGFFEYRYALLTSDDLVSYQDELVGLASSDPSLAFSRFNEILTDDPLSYNSCHGLAHQMGHATYEALGFEDAMGAQNALCGGGYIHGVLEAHFGLLQEDALLRSVTDLCSPGANSCYHGIGHGLMIALTLDVEKSLSYCDLLPGVGARNCYDGVWMHIFDLEESGVPKESDLYFSSSEGEAAMALCQNQDDIYKSSCYFYLPRILAHHDELAFSNSIELCDVVEDDYQVACSAGTGHSNMKYHIADPNDSLRACEDYSSDLLIQACKEGALLYYLYSIETSADVESFEDACMLFEGTGDREVCEHVRGYRKEL